LKWEMRRDMLNPVMQPGTAQRDAMFRREEGRDGAEGRPA
jgi:hypothetical protein